MIELTLQRMTLLCPRGYKEIMQEAVFKAISSGSLNFWLAFIFHTLP